MRLGLQLPSFTFPGGPAAIRSVNLPEAHRFDQITALGGEVLPEIAGVIAA
jgi:hypothetical protein